MKLPRRKFLHLAAGAGALPALPRIALAQAYPSRRITIVVPFPPGALTDSIARVIAEGMADVAWSTRHHPKCRRRRRHHRDRPRRPRGARRIHTRPRHLEHTCHERRPASSWEGEKVFARSEVLEVRNVEGRLHVARKPRHHDEWNPPIVSQA